VALHRAPDSKARSVMWERVWDRVQGKAPKGARRHRLWRKIRREHLSRDPRCAVCGGTRKIRVHHIVPFHLAPAMELEPENLMTLGEAGK
jgi:5-methylcytosine-specific restriction endonuclease McrA